jgi:DNA-binding transcriptional MerR regulator
MTLIETQNSSAAGEVGTYRSGTAARLAGVPVATLRVWERRYDAIGPRTSPHGHRRYSDEDVSRLALLKALVEAGHPIGAIAHLPTERLRELRGAPAGDRVPASNAAARVAVVGETLAAQVASHASPALHVVAACAELGRAPETMRGVSAEVLAIELPALRDEAVDSIEALAAQVGAARVIVAHRFGTRHAAAALRRRGHVVVRAPLDLSDIGTLAALAPAAEAAHPAAPRFDERTLASLGQSSTAMYCECPRHVVELLRSLGAFERYSAECLNRSPPDAELHRYLERVAGTARVLFEEALERVARAEGIPLPRAPEPAGG